jgi:hypothetical protein
MRSRATRDEQESIKHDLSSKIEKLQIKSDSQVSQTELANLLLDLRKEIDEKFAVVLTGEQFSIFEQRLL